METFEFKFEIDSIIKTKTVTDRNEFFAYITFTQENEFDEIIIEDIFGNPFPLKGKIMGYKTHGYNLKSGGWALYEIDNCTPAKFMLFKQFRKRKISVFNMNIILKINKVE